jgi:tetratricopeptide (TPR) repeat protein
LRVYIFASDRDYQKYHANPQSAGFYLNNGDGDFIVLSEADALKRNASHEYLHMVMHYSSGGLPHWFEEGIADLYSTLSASATQVEVGDPIPAYLRLLASQLWMDAEDLSLGSSADGPLFYAESWALVHMLSFSPEWRKGMPGFLKLLKEGGDQDDAFQTAFGASMQNALVALHAYAPARRGVTVPAPPPLPNEQASSARLTSTHLSQVEVALMLADLALHSGNRELAKSLLTGAAKENPQSSAAAAGLGLLALAENRKQDAQREFERALSLGPAPGFNAADTYFQLAMLTGDNALLEKTLTVDPHFAEAHFLLGVRATDKGDFQRAVEHLRQAIAVYPRRFSYWNALGYAQAKSRDREGAADSARRASVIASTAEEHQMAASLALLAAETAPSVPAKKPDVITPPSWKNPKGDAHLEGTLTRVDCDAQPLRLTISAASGQAIELKVSHPKEVELLNAEGVSTALACGEQSRPIAIEYLAATSEVTRIEFKPVAVRKR